jgi:hypothetical protein
MGKASAGWPTHCALVTTWPLGACGGRLSLAWACRLWPGCRLAVESRWWPAQPGLGLPAWPGCRLAVESRRWPAQPGLGLPAWPGCRLAVESRWWWPAQPRLGLPAWPGCRLAVESRRQPVQPGWGLPAWPGCRLAVDSRRRPVRPGWGLLASASLGFREEACAAQKQRCQPHACKHGVSTHPHTDMHSHSPVDPT